MYHLFFEDSVGTHLGSAFGPIPAVGTLIEVEVEPGHQTDLLVMQVRLHAGKINGEETPTINTATIICGREIAVPRIDERDVPALLKRAGTLTYARRIGVTIN